MPPGRSEGRNNTGSPLDTLFYRDYMGSPAWEQRKAEYYERHAKVCKICGATKNVQLNHIKYGSYGRELDRDLVPLCGDHHQSLHDKIGVRKNMHYQTEYFIADMIAEWDAAHEGAPVAQIVQKPAAKSAGPSVIEKALEKGAAPIWKMIGVVSRRR